MTRLTMRTAAVAVAAAAALGLMGFTASSALADASLTLSRTPAPPQTVRNDGNNDIFYSYQLTFDGEVPVKAVEDIQDCTTGLCTTLPGSQREVPLAGEDSPYISPQRSYRIPMGSPAGRYLVRVYFYSAESCASAGNPGCALPVTPGFDSRAGDEVAFTVSAASGTVNITKYEDLNGDGIRQGDEPGVAGWNFQVTSPNINPLGAPQTTGHSTDGAGNIELTDVPVGNYTVQELLPSPNPSGWAATGIMTQTFTLADGQTRNLEFGNARRTSLCGTVFKDLNANHVWDVGEPAFGDSGVQLILGGADGRGNVVAAATQTNASGRYCFNDLMPGSYRVSEIALPAGWTASADKDGPANGYTLINPIVVTSGQPSDGNDFGLAPPAPEPVIDRPVVRKPVTVTEPVVERPVIQQPVVQPVVQQAAPEARTRLCLAKRVNRAKVRQGHSVTWTLRVSNCGQHAAHEVAINDPLLGSTTLRSSGGATLVRGQLVWSVGTLQPGQSKRYRFVTRFDRDARTGKHTNRAKAGARNADEVQADASTRVVQVKRKPKRVAVTG